MTTIIYRTLTKEDYPTIKKLISQAFGFHKYISEPQLLDHCLSIYLNTCLAETSFSSVAVQDGEVVGLILGHSKKGKHLVSPLKSYINALYHALGLGLGSKKGRTLLGQLKSTGEVYKQLSNATPLNFDGSITLFIVDSKCQGHGVGKTLMEQLMSYMHAQNAKHIYLYTDTNCNYGFYDHQGFSRLATQTATFFDHKVSLDMFLYGYRLQP